MNSQIQELAQQFFGDLDRESLTPTEDNLRAWLWFTCPGHLRSTVEPAIRADQRWTSHPTGQRTERIAFRVTPIERHQLQESADKVGVKLGQYIRSKIL